MINRKNRKIAAVVTAMMLFSAAAPFTALQAEAAGASTAKEEVVYGNLNHDGSVKDVYVVNIFREEGDKITDYGDYSQVRNLTTNDKINVKNQCMTIETDKRPLYYEGVMENAELPWNIDISYKLNGSTISAEDLAGKSGELGIYISVKENSRCDKAFFENFGLQITLSLDGNLCRDIQTEGATIANVGSNKQLTYTVLPGKGADIAITSQVIDFTMDQISINGIKLNLNVDIDTSQLTGEAKKIQDATKLLDDGAGKIDSGAQELNEGTSALNDGAAELNEGTAALKEGTAELKENSSKLVSAMETLEANVSFAAYKAILEENGLTIDLRDANNEAIEKIEKLEKLLKVYPDMEPLMKPMIEQLIQLLEANNAVHDGTEQYLDEVNSKLNELKDAVGEFDEGIAAVDDGASELNGGAGELADGTAQLKDGAAQLKDGTSQLKDGTGTMKDETSSIDKKISDKVEQMQSEVIGNDMNDVSFVSGKNTDVDAVQFVLKTEAVKAKNTDDQAAAEPEKKGFFQKLLDLFR